MTAPITSREELLLVRLREAADHRGYPESFGGSWTQLALDALREIERLRAGVAQTSCCYGLAPSSECRCEQERAAQGHPPYHRSEPAQACFGRLNASKGVDKQR